MNQHDWYEIPSRIIARRWCKRCGIYSDGEDVGGLFTTKWDWKYVVPGNPPRVVTDEPPCIVHS